MFKIWSIVILAVTMLFAGIAVMSLDNRAATPEQLAYTGTWLCADGSGERLHITLTDKSYAVKIVSPYGQTALSCESGRLEGDRILFRNTGGGALSDDEPWAYVSIQMAGGTISVEGFGADGRIFRRAPGSEPQEEAY